MSGTQFNGLLWSGEVSRIRVAIKRTTTALVSIR